MITPKPIILSKKTERPARKPKRMTIAIGMLYDEGLIIAADTLASLTDGTTRYATKIHQTIANSGAYVIVTCPLKTAHF